jgi:tetratricopeptide (TPR) repeat protein
MFESNTGYKREEDFYETGDKRDDDEYDNILLNKDIQLFSEEMAEPDISFWCNDDQEASALLRKCISYMNDKKWSSLKVFLNEIDEMETPRDNIVYPGNNEGSINKHSFVKNFYLGVAYCREKNYSFALDRFLEANKLYQYYQLHYNIAICYMKTNKLEEAALYFDGVITKSPNFFFAYYNLIKIYLIKHNPGEAYVYYRKLSDLVKRDRDKEKDSNMNNVNNRLSATSMNVLKLFYKLGAECCFHQGYFQECIHTILEALKFNPEDPELWCLYGKVFIMKKAFEYAKPLIERALEIDKNNIEAINLLKILEDV